MFARFVEYLCRQMIANRTIAAAERDVYVFGMRALFTQSAHVLLVLLCGYCYGLVVESIVFLATYMPLRIYAGGYHAATNTKCFISSVFMVIIILAIIKVIPGQLALVIVVGLVSVAGVIIYRYAPVDNANKPLDAIEQVVYRKKAIRAAVLIIAGALLCCYAALPTYGLTFSLGLFAESILILLEIHRQNSKQP